jgi:hypothetical protein
MSANDTFLAVFLGEKSSPKMVAWNALPEAERQKKAQTGIAAWKGWVEANQAVIETMGGPLGKTKRVSATGIEDVSNAMGAFMQWEPSWSCARNRMKPERSFSKIIRISRISPAKPSR